MPTGAPYLRVSQRSSDANRCSVLRCEADSGSKSEPRASRTWPWVNSMVRACSVPHERRGELRVSGALKLNHLAKGVNPDSKSVLLQEVGGLGLKLISSSCKSF
jgi:hypothetical protein